MDKISPVFIESTTKSGWKLLETHKNLKIHVWHSAYPEIAKMPENVCTWYVIGPCRGWGWGVKKVWKLVYVIYECTLMLSDASVAKDLKASWMDLYPVHRHIFPSKMCSISWAVALGFFSRKLWRNKKWYVFCYYSTVLI